jgi:G3E family GTPase
MMATELIPVSVLTGFLGSGKTTILSHLLRQPEFSHTAVVINEFGEVALDHELIEKTEDSVIALTTGCLCCRVRSDLTKTLQDLLRRRDEGACTQFNRIVIETSGLADPAPILHALMTDTALASRLVLGNVVTTVDAVAGEVTLEREAISRKQVAVADRIVLSKLDLAGEVEASLHNRLSSLNPGAPTSRAVYGRIESDNLFDLALHDPKARVLDISSWLAEAPEHNHSAHDAEIKSFTVVRVEPIQAVALTLFLEALAEHCGADLLRLKGIVNVAESPQQPAVIHGVQHVFHAPAWLRHWPSDDRTSRMVLITRRIRREWVEVLIDAISAEVAEVSASNR